MRISVKVKARAKIEKIEGDKDNGLIVSVKARPEKGKANLAVGRAVAAHFGVSPARIKVVSGSTSKNKILEIK